MNFRSLIFTDSENNKKKESKDEGSSRKFFKSKFPSSVSIEGESKEVSVNSTFPSAGVSEVTSISSDTPSCGPHLDNIMDMYEKGFDNLNQNGYDFYEYFKAVMQVGVDNPEMYKMAFTMGKTMDETVSKNSLINQSQFYINEITNVHKHYVNTGKSKRDEMVREKSVEESKLQKEVSDIGTEVKRLTALKSQKENQLSTIDTKYVNEITDIECKLLANDMSRDAIISSINKVVKGINDNIQ